MSGIPCRLIREVGTVAYLRVYWGDDCSNCLGKGGKGFHNGQVFLTRSTTPEDWDLGGRVEEHAEAAWPTTCEHCGATAPSPDLMGDDGYGNQKRVLNRQVFRQRQFDTASGRPEVGDLFWAKWLHHLDDEGVLRCFEWDDCPDPRGHLYCVLPGGHEWDLQGRASNCTMPKDKAHRCWVAHGEPPNLHVDKNGKTCAAGAGSIVVPGWHGFLHGGRLVG